MILALVAVAALASSTPPSALPTDVQRGFDTAVAMRHMRVIAHDSMQGRDSPSPGLELTADYIIRELRAAGVQPVRGSYEHRYTLERVNLSTNSTLSLRKGALATDFELKKDFIPFERTGDVPVRNARLVFAGYGIDAPEYGYNDYDGLNVRGAVVLIIRGEPENSTDTTWFDGKRQTKYAFNGTKARIARQYGAVGMIVVDRIRAGRKPIVSGWPWPSLFPAMPISALPLASVDSSDRLPMVHVGTRFIESVADSVGALVRWVETIDSTKAPLRVDVGDARVSMSVQLHRTPVPLRNVMGMIPAAAPTDEYVVMGAHYDHIGVGKPVAGDSVFNGADDNGSGTSSLLMAAQAMGRATSRPKRNIVVVFFSAEEKGLLGSKAFTKDSPLPLKNCVAMINTDMIGRLEGPEVTMGGLARCPDLAAMNEEERQRLGLSFGLNGNGEPYFFRSDQANFAMKRIPVLFYFTGEHGDYHKLGDELHKINATAMVDIMKLATATAWRAAERERTTYIPAGFEDAE
jgi:hypothetical protein